MKQAQSKQVSENQFYGKRGLLNLQRQLEQISTVTKSTVFALLNAAWQDCQTEEDKQLFFILIFSVGDIENREHNMFKVKVNQGGHSKRELFRCALEWSLQNQPSFFYKLMPVIAEYTNYENLFYNQLRTQAKGKKVTSWEALSIDKAKVAEFIHSKLSDTLVSDFEKGLIAKFLPKIPANKRWRKDKDGKSFAQVKQADTQLKDEWNKELIVAIKKACSWDSKQYTQFRSQHLKNTEAHLFSTKKIQDFDALQFKAWLDTLPSGARYRVQCRLFEKTKESAGKLVAIEKWTLKGGVSMPATFTQWENEKEEAMKKLVALTEEDKKEMSTKELKTLEKQAKINTGATTLFDAFKELYPYSGSTYGVQSIDTSPATLVKIQQLVDKIKLDVPVLVCLDNSPSMDGGLQLGDKGKYIRRLEFAMFATAIMLYRNPSEEMKSFMLTFNSVGKVIHDGGYGKVTTGGNRFIQTSRDVKVDSLVKKGEPFIETFKQLKSIIHTSGGTRITAISQALRDWVNEDSADRAQKVETIQNYPVWLVISDGDLNNGYSAKSSMEEFQRDMLHWFGASPVVVLWDLNDNKTGTTFEGLDNFIHINGLNPSTINQVFLNINDIDILDVFITLKTIFLSDRYAPIKQVLTQ